MVVILNKVDVFVLTVVVFLVMVRLVAFTYIFEVVKVFFISAPVVRTMPVLLCGPAVRVVHTLKIFPVHVLVLVALLVVVGRTTCPTCPRRARSCPCGDRFRSLACRGTDRLCSSPPSRDQ